MSNLISPAHLLRETGAERVGQRGALEVRKDRFTKATVYYESGEIYGIEILNYTPPIKQRLQWSLEQSVHSGDAATLIQARTDRDIFEELLSRTLISETQVSTIAREAFIAMVEAVLTWGQVSGKWHGGKILARETFLTVPHITPERLLGVIEDRVKKLEEFTEWVNVNPEDVGLIDVESPLVVPDIIPNSDVQSLIMTHVSSRPNISQLKGWSGTIPLTRITSALQELQEAGLIRLFLGNHELPYDDGSGVEGTELPPEEILTTTEGEAAELAADREAPSSSALYDADGNINLDGIFGSDEEEVEDANPEVEFADLQDDAFDAELNELVSVGGDPVDEGHLEVKSSEQFEEVSQHDEDYGNPAPLPNLEAFALANRDTTVLRGENADIDRAVAEAVADPDDLFDLESLGFESSQGIELDESQPDQEEHELDLREELDLIVSGFDSPESEDPTTEESHDMSSDNHDDDFDILSQIQKVISKAKRSLVEHKTNLGGIDKKIVNAKRGASKCAADLKRLEEEREKIVGALRGFEGEVSSLGKSREALSARIKKTESQIAKFE